MKPREETLSREVAEAVLLAAAEQCKANPKLIRGKDRRRFIVEARQLITAVLREGGWGFQEIADFLTDEGKGNHTNPHHWYKMHHKDLTAFDYYRISYDILKSCHDDNYVEFARSKGKLINSDIYMELKNKYDLLKVRHDALVMDNKLVKQSAEKLKTQMSQLWN